MGFSPTNGCSIAITVGWCVAMSSPSSEKMCCNRCSIGSRATGAITSQASARGTGSSPVTLIAALTAGV